MEVDTYTRMHKHLYAGMCTYVYVFVYVHKYTKIHTCTPLLIYTHVHVSIYTCIHVYAACKFLCARPFGSHIARVCSGSSVRPPAGREASCEVSLRPPAKRAILVRARRAVATPCVARKRAYLLQRSMPFKTALQDCASSHAGPLQN